MTQLRGTLDAKVATFGTETAGANMGLCSVKAVHGYCLIQQTKLGAERGLLYDSSRGTLLACKVAAFYFQGKKSSERAACRSEAVRVAIWARYQGTRLQIRLFLVQAASGRHDSCPHASVK